MHFYFEFPLNSKGICPLWQHKVLFKPTLEHEMLLNITDEGLFFFLTGLTAAGTFTY